jgi:hypothetical protein
MFKESFCMKQHESVRRRVKLDRIHFAKFESLAIECDNNFITETLSNTFNYARPEILLYKL